MTRIFESKRGAKFNAFPDAVQILVPDGVEWIHLDKDEIKELIKALIQEYV